MSIPIIAACIVSAVAVLFLKQHRPELAMLLSAAAGALVLVALVSPTLQIAASLGERLSGAGLSEIFKVLLKVMGICYLTDFAADLCRDFGQSSLASKVELAGKISVIGLCLPLVDTLLSITDKLIGK